MTLHQALADRPRRPGPPRWLVAVAALETLSLAVLVGNLLTMDVRPLAAALGPVHGMLYLAIVIGVAAQRPGWRVVVLAVVPALGGLLACGALRRRAGQRAGRLRAQAKKASPTGSSPNA